MRRVFLAIAICTLSIVCEVRAEIIGGQTLKIDFTDADDVKAKATWAKPDQIVVTKDGLGWDGDRASLTDGWIETKPLAIGTSWRPACGMDVRVSILPPPREIELDNGQKFTHDPGDVYARYSPDKVHWSNWQVLQRNNDLKQRVGRFYSGQIRVPYRDREEYGKLLSEYFTLDVPWKSDEEAAVKWIVPRNPNFFAKNNPFIGYVEFLYEAGFYGGQRITAFKAEITWGVGGLSSIPKDPAVREKHKGEWRFEGKQEMPPKEDSSAK